MTTPKNWTPPPEMPSDLPPLPMGKNGRPLVYVTDPLPNLFAGYSLQWRCGKWSTWLYLDECDGLSTHYAVESDSEFCREKQWGDFDPRNKPVEPAKPQTVLDVYRADVAAKLEEADKIVSQLEKSLAEWEAYHTQLSDALFVLDGGSPLARKQWYDVGRKDERHHKPVRTIFPLHP